MTNEQDYTGPDAAPAQPNAGSRPTVKFSGWGGLSVAVWKQKSENGPDHYSIRIDRTYKNDKEQLNSTTYLRAIDLLRAQKLLGQADDWIEQDRAKHRSGGAQAAAASLT